MSTTHQTGYTIAAALAFAGFRNAPVVVFVDGVPHSFVAMTMVAVANGRYFGGGMCIAADADPADGQLTVVVLDGQSLIDFALKKRHLVKGTIATQPGVTVLHGRRAQVVPANTGAGVWSLTKVFLHRLHRCNAHQMRARRGAAGVGASVIHRAACSVAVVC